MDRRCKGTWTEPEHAPVIFGHKEPLGDKSPTDGACDACVRAMGATLTCRICQEVETPNGLCAHCEFKLATEVGKPSWLLTVYKQDGSMSGPYDGAGVLLRLQSAMEHPSFRSFSIERIAVEAGAR